MKNLRVQNTRDTRGAGPARVTYVRFQTYSHSE